MNLIYIIVGIGLLYLMYRYYRYNPNKAKVYLNGDVIVRVHSELGSTVAITFRSRGTYYLSFVGPDGSSPLDNRTHTVQNAPTTLRLHHTEMILPITIGIGTPGSQDVQTFKEPTRQ